MSNAMELSAQYDHHAAQERWYAYWEAQRFFHAEPTSDKPPFSIVIPPPNVTGALHLGHALNNTLQDILVRQKRMQGYNVLWMPGTDHAGIATQAVVERRLLEEEKLSRHDLGREKLVERIWTWKEQYETRILGQLKQLGCSCDWERTRFTLDDVCARAVRDTFFRLFRDDKIYRGKRLVNWDTFLQTAVSDDEVYHSPIKGHFWHFRYPVIAPQPGEPTHVTIATTRPETMLGDTAVAVHPQPAQAIDKQIAAVEERLAASPAKEKEPIQAQLDSLRERRESMLPQLEQLRDMANRGCMLELPLTGRQIPLISDVWAKPELGSGCVKITPAHDANDYEVWKRNSEIGAINILNTDGTLNDQAGDYAGLSMKEARKRVVADLEAQDLVVEIEDREIDLAHSDRSKTPIEPFLADQWFVKMDELAQSAMDAVTDDRVKIFPTRYAKGYLDWLSEKRDWPVGRQLWWGHRIPIWYAEGIDESDVSQAFQGRDDVHWTFDAENDRFLICAQQEDLASDAIPGTTLRQDEEVLDTWFSSALWPHSTLGWPEETDELSTFYPTSTLITSRDIITLWVARMVLAGIYNRGEIPFHEVYIHPKILDGFGETMSKSKGNGVDPLDVIEKFGADSLRFGIAHLTTETQDVKMPVEFECPHCQALLPQTKKNRIQPRIECPKCNAAFSTQWAEKTEDKELPRGSVVGERFELGRNFCNKLWNASRFSLQNLAGYQSAAVAPEDLLLEDRWLLSRLATVTSQVTDSLAAYRYADAARALYDFAWDEFCSFYIEMTKTRFGIEEQRATAQRVLAHALDTLLRLLHPIIPFLTEEVWHLLAELAPQRGLDKPTEASESVCIAPWPEVDVQWQDEQIEQQFAQFQAVLGAVREIRMRQNVPPKEDVEAFVRCDAATAALLEPMQPYFQQMARTRLVACGPSVESPELAASVALSGIEVHLDIRQFIDVAAEKKRLQKQFDELNGRASGIEKKLANEQFTSRAPAEVVQAQRDTLTEVQQQMEVVQAAMEKLPPA